MTHASGGMAISFPTPAIRPRETTMVAFSKGGPDTGTTLAPRMAKYCGSPPCARRGGAIQRTAKRAAKQTADTHLRTTLECMQELLARALKGQPSPGNRKGRRMRLVGSFGRVKKAMPQKKWTIRKQIAGGLRFFYCIPIGTVAYTIWASHRSPLGEDNGRQSGRLARNTRFNGSENAASPRAATRIRNRAPHRANQRRPAGRELRNALSRPAEAGAGGLHFLRVGHLEQQPQS